MKIVVITFIGIALLGAIAVALFESCSRSLDYQKLMSLERDLVSFAVQHRDCLPASWEKLVEFDGNNAVWSLQDLEDLGALRWSWDLRKRPEDNKVLFITSERYRRYENEANREILKQWAPSSK